MNDTLAERVARNAELAGFGPCVALDEATVKCHHKGAIHTVRIPSGGPHLIYGNPVDPVIQGTFCLIRDVYGATAYHPDMTEIKFTPKITTRTHYLWMHDFTTNDRLVLVELLLEGVPVWHKTYTLPYNATVDPHRWEKIALLFDNYIASQRRSDPSGVSAELLTGCATAAKVRAGKEA
jgi:hypothetical protein